MEDSMLKKIENIQRLRRQHIKDRFIKDWNYEAKEFTKYIEKCYTIKNSEDLAYMLWFELRGQREHADFSEAVIYNVNSIEIIGMLWRYLQVYRYDNDVTFGDWN